MKEIVSFLQQLEANNCREWFNAHKEEYLRCKERFDRFTAQLIEGIRGFDDSIGPLTVQNCTYRIYRDTRFSSDKTPYKTHFGAFVVPGGKKSGYSGYYFQVGWRESGFPGGCMLGTGDYCCPAPLLRTLREDIVLDEGEAMDRALREADGFVLDRSESLKRVPAGLPADRPYSHYLKLKNFCLLKEPGLEYMLAPGLLERVLRDFEKTRPFLQLINRAVGYVREVGG